MSECDHIIGLVDVGYDGSWVTTARASLYQVDGVDETFKFCPKCGQKLVEGGGSSDPSIRVSVA